MAGFFVCSLFTVMVYMAHGVCDVSRGEPACAEGAEDVMLQTRSGAKDLSQAKCYAERDLVADEGVEIRSVTETPFSDETCQAACAGDPNCYSFSKCDAIHQGCWLKTKIVTKDDPTSTDSYKTADMMCKSWYQTPCTDNTDSYDEYDGWANGCDTLYSPVQAPCVLADFLRDRVKSGMGYYFDAGVSGNWCRTISAANVAAVRQHFADGKWTGPSPGISGVTYLPVPRPKPKDDDDDDDDEAAGNTYRKTIGGYIYASAADAAVACIEEGYQLCSKQQVIDGNEDLCSAGWTSDAGRGWYRITDGSGRGCGYPGWNSWGPDDGRGSAHCCVKDDDGDDDDEDD